MMSIVSVFINKTPVVGAILTICAPNFIRIRGLKLTGFPGVGLFTTPGYVVIYARKEVGTTVCRLPSWRYSKTRSNHQRLAG